MRKIVNFIKENILFIASLFLLAFIPLYPKLPIIKVEHTWVYVRAEDFIIASVLTLWVFLVLFKKVKLKTPLTTPILLFWLIGAIATIHGVLLIFPTIANVFPNVAILSFFRRVEYLSLFFIAYVSIKDKKYIYPVIWVLSLTLLLVVLYGLGQKALGFPAFLTGNEEFAKGTAFRISSLGRITSTFAGHYDLAAYLVLIIPILTSLAFGFKNIIAKASLLILASLGFGLLFMTVSRISFFVLLLSLAVLLILQKKKIAVISLLILTVAFLIFFPSLLARFNNTVSQVDVLVYAPTGQALGQVIEIPKEYFKDKVILKNQVNLQDIKATSSSSLVLPYASLPAALDVLLQPNVPTGETLPQGTGYINLPLSPIMKRTGQYFTEKTIDQGGIKSLEVRVFEGNFLVKKARAYDLSSTTRFQGEWPKTIDAFKRNIFLGSGYGSVGLAVDNNYLRILGESGLLGFLSFLSLFLIAGIYIRKSFNKIDSPVARSFVLGFVTGAFGLMLNGLFIDVFDASKIAFTFWSLVGITLGILHLYSTEEQDILKEIKKTLTSKYAIIVYIFAASAILFLPMVSNYFVGDDFTWFRWAQNPQSAITSFINSGGFFYRPGARLYYSLMYQLFWLNQTPYHIASILLHSVAVSVLFLTLLKILKNYALTIISVVLFLTLSGYHEAVFWVSATGFLFNAIFALSAVLTYIYWKEKGKTLYLVLSIASIVLSFLFHELGVISPLLVIVYDLIFGGEQPRFKKIYFLILSPLIPYALLRLLSNSHWFSGDYNYNILRLPFNFVGNLVGYFMLDLLGPQSLKIYESLRTVLKGNIVLAVPIFAAILAFLWIAGKFMLKRLSKFEQKIIVFSVLFFIISLLPFLALGNITSRYGYLSSVGFVVIMSIFIKKGFEYLRTIADRYVYLMVSVLITLIFMSVQLFQLQGIHNDWMSAGEKVNNFLVSFEGAYKDYWKDGHMNFYFANTPIRKGEAWVFPVGLSDSIRFAFPDLNMSVYEVGSLNDAFSQNPNPNSSGVFLFDDTGRVQEFYKTKNGIIVPR